ncbi:MAG: hypothetical protein HY964_00385 [Ignavibacteriales bacterium]|nr:hypothetical protein [Ignavibacteriales bacterium]
MRRIIYISFVLLLWINISLSQQADSSQAEFLQKAPTRVKDYYRVFDSLAHPTWNKSRPEEWSDAELKKYASMIYDANEYDPIAKRKLDSIRFQTAFDAKTPYFVREVDVFNEIEKHLPIRYKRLISLPYFITIVVEDIENIKLPSWDRPTEILTSIIVHGRVTEVWKGKKYNVGDNITFYYLADWNYRGFVRGSSYVVSLFPVFDKRTDSFILRLGGYNTVQEAVFPIEQNNIIDVSNLFGLGKIVERKTFIDSLTSTINEIKSWRNFAR